MKEFDLAAINAEFEQSSPQNIIDWTLNQFAENKKALVTTNFSPYEAVILHLVTSICPNIKVLWIDSGYNLNLTYQFAEKLITRLNLNLVVYTPLISASRQDAVFGGIPLIDETESANGVINIAHDKFSECFKLEPFRRAMAELAPNVWLTALRREQTAFRSNMNILTKAQNMLKVSPLLNWTVPQLEDYLKLHNLPNELKYFDPTKAFANRECGLHTKII